MFAGGMTDSLRILGCSLPGLVPILGPECELLQEPSGSIPPFLSPPPEAGAQTCQVSTEAGQSFVRGAGVVTRVGEGGHRACLRDSQVTV